MRGKRKDIIIAIDGPAGAGKSSVASKVAKKLNYAHLDTGSMYRGATFYLLKNEIPLDSKDFIISRLKKMDMQVEGKRIFVDNEDITGFLRSPEVENNISLVSSMKEVREILIEKQREIASVGKIVMDGRDIGTQVFPDAELKIFLSASPEIRAKRRYDQMKGEIDLEKTKGFIHKRDHSDKNREVGPLRPAPDCVYLDSSHLTEDEVVEKIVMLAREVIRNR